MRTGLRCRRKFGTIQRFKSKIIPTSASTVAAAPNIMRPRRDAVGRLGCCGKGVASMGRVMTRGLIDCCRLGDRLAEIVDKLDGEARSIGNGRAEGVGVGLVFNLLLLLGEGDDERGVD